MAQVLICDDYAPLRASLGALLRVDGHDTLEAENGAEAKALLDAAGVDVLLLDLNMPVMDGRQLLRELTCPPPAVIILSAFEFITATGQDDEFSHKIHAVLKKPVAPDELRRAIDSALGAP